MTDPKTFVLFFTNRSRPGMHAFSAAGADKADYAGTWSHLFRSMIDFVWRCKCGFIICHDVSSFKRRLADQPPFRPAYSTKRNMPGLGLMPGSRTWLWAPWMRVRRRHGSHSYHFALEAVHRVCWKWLAASFLAPKDRIGPTLHPLHANSASWSHKCHVAQVSEYDRQKVYAGWLRS